MPELRGGASLANETLAGDVAVNGGGVDDLERDGAAETGVEGLVGDAHGAAAQLEERTVLAAQHFVMVEDGRLGHGRKYKAKGRRLKAKGGRRQKVKF